MMIRLLDGPSGQDLLVTVHDPEATVADLIAAVSPGGGEVAVSVDGREVRPANLLNRVGLADGSEVALEPAHPGGHRGPGPGAAASPAVVLTVVGGPDAGRRIALRPGSWMVGRAAASAQEDHATPGVPVGNGRVGDDGVVGSEGEPLHAAGRVAVTDPTLSTRHLALRIGADGTIRAADVGSTNGTTIDGKAVDATAVPVALGAEITCGRTRLRLGLGPVDEPLPPPPAPGSTTRPLHRRPRVPVPRPEAPVAAPAPPERVPTVTSVGLVVVLASLAVGGAMVLLLNSWAYGAFALLGPVLLVAGALDSRRRRRRSRRSGDRRRRRDLADLEGELGRRVANEIVGRSRLHPAVSEVVDRVRTEPASCWQRRRGDHDAYLVHLGTGEVPWDPPVDGEPATWAQDVASVVDRHRSLVNAPVSCPLDPAAPIAVVGPHAIATALVRSVVVQAVADHGPADLCLAVLTAADHAVAWDWAAWLPHARHGEGTTLLATGGRQSDAVAAALLGAAGDPGASAAVGPGAGASGPVQIRTVVVLDDAQQLRAGRSAARSVLRAAADPSTGLVPIVVVEAPEEVPAVCRLVFEVNERSELRGPPALLTGTGHLTGVSADTAKDTARRLARFDDPELPNGGRRLPTSVSLAALTTWDITSEQAVAARWRAAGGDPPPQATIGVAEDGPVVVDLVADGPHALVAGTTGAGKSELLRTLVASLAAGSSPDHLTFVLIDFKGGSAFDACDRLPHVTGVVTDLDDHLAARALLCLEAELHHRERRLRAAGVEDLATFRRAASSARTTAADLDEPLPRLVVVIDEFATLAAELPDFVDSLVGIAQRGRSLGVHLVLATQRPSGSVSDHIKANTNLRVCLRVHDSADSRDVIDRPDAAELPRRHPGRALARLGPSELVAFQAARSTGTGATRRATPVTAVPLTLAAMGCEETLDVATADEPVSDLAATAGTAPTDLDLLVEAVGQAWTRLGGGLPRRAWPDPLPATVELGGPELAGPIEGTDRSHGVPVTVGLADDPERQRHVPFAWDLDDGPLLAVGLPGSGTDLLATSVVVAAAARWGSDELHVHVIDLGSGVLGPLGGLDQVGAVIGAAEPERQRRLLADLAAELAERQAAGWGERPRRLLVLGGLTSFRATWDDLEPSGAWSTLVDLAARGASVGLHVLVTGDGSGPIPHRLLAACRQRLIFRLADRNDHAAFGITASTVPDLPRGRAVAAHTGALVQAATAEKIAGREGPAAPGVVLGPPWSRPGSTSRSRCVPSPVPVLPEHITLSDLATPWAGLGAQGMLTVTVGVDEESLGVARLQLGVDGHAVISGPRGSGRTSALATLAAAGRSIGANVVVIAAGQPSHPDQGRPDPGPPDCLDASDPALEEWIDLWRATVRSAPLLVLVDDADLTPDEDPALSALALSRQAGVHLVVAGQSDRLRSRYGHWTREVLAHRTGLLLAPDVELDGDLVGSRLPRRLPLGPRPGLAWRVSGGSEGLVQLALPPTV
ncbi:MAG: FtsK/SpoIIIE domain-containing protein [Acidimicrobiales bacterium]